MGISMFEEEEAKKEKPEAIPAAHTDIVPDTNTNTYTHTNTLSRPVTPGFVILFFALVLLPFVLYYAYQWSKAGTTINTTITENDDLNNGLVGHWTFDGPDSNMRTLMSTDVSGNGNEGTWVFMSTTSSPTAGRLGQAIRFPDASLQKVYVYPSATINDLAQKTISTWIKVDQTVSGFRGIVTKASSNGGTGWSLFISNSTNGLVWDQDFSTTDGRWEMTTALPLKQWVHVTVTYDQTSTTTIPLMYIDSNSVNLSVSASPVGTASSDASQGLIIGNDALTSSLPGAIDDVRVYNRTLSASEVKRLYELGATTHINTTITENDDLNSGLVGHWTFDGPDMNWASTTAEVTDVSGSSNHGNASGLTQSSVAAGKIGQAARFDGNDNVNTGMSNLVGATSLSFATWVYTGSDRFDGSYHSLIDDSNGAPYGFDGFYVYLDDRGASASPMNGVWAMLQADGGCVDALAYNVISSSGWYHIVFTYNGATAAKKIYVNGESRTLTAGISCEGGSGNFVPNTNRNMYLGQQLNGTLDDSRIYNRAISASEVKRLYELGATTHINTTIDTNDSLESGLVGHWTFDGPKMAWASTTAEVLDSSASSIEGDLNNMSQQSATAGKIGQGLKFTKTMNQAIVVSGASISNLTRKSVSMWIKPQSYGENNGGAIVHKDLGWKFRFSSATTSALQIDESFTGPDGQWVSSTGLVDLNKWTHVIYSFDNSSATNDPVLYINGVSTSLTEVGTPSGSGSNDSGMPLYFGGDIGTFDFDGVIDDVRIYNRVLSPAEVTRLYELGGGR